MRLDTKKRKKATRGFEKVYGREKLIDQMFQVFCKGKQGLDAFLLEIGRMMAETIMYIEREEMAGPERGMSSQKYSETVIETAGAFGVSASSVSRHIVDITAKKLKEFKERDLSDFIPFAVFIDTIHRGGEAIMVCLGIDVDNQSRASIAD